MNWDGRLISLKTRPYPEESRVKWWRKKAREGNLPPILVWYTPLLQSFLILDGHRRLAAAQIEGYSPEFVVVYSMSESDPYILEKEREHVVRNLTAPGNPITVDKMNDILIRFFDDRPITQKILIATAVTDAGDWESEVDTQLNNLGLSEDREMFIQE